MWNRPDHALSPRAVHRLDHSPRGTGFHRPHQRFTGDFVKVEELGRGGFGRVYKARHKLDGNMYAVKRLCVRRGGHRNLEEEEKILREVSTLARLSHAHVVRYYQAWMESGSIVDLQESEDDGVDDDSWEEESEKVPTASGLDRCQDCRQEYRPWTAHLFDLPLQPPDSSLCQDCYQQQMTATGHTDVCSLLQFSEAQTDAVLTLPHFLYIQMEYCVLTLTDLIAARRLEGIPELAWSLTGQIAEGLSYIHSRDIVHRDLKPDNIFLTGEGLGVDGGQDLQLLSDDQLRLLQVKIGDFGLAKHVSVVSTAEPVQSLARIHIAVSMTKPLERSNETTDIGTLLYMPPNLHDLAWGPAADMYTLGILMFELLQPFKTGMERIETLQALRQPRLLFPDGFESAHFQEAIIIRRLLQRNALLRPSAAEVVACTQLAEQVLLKRCGSSPTMSGLTRSRSTAAMPSTAGLRMVRPPASLPASPGRRVTTPASADEMLSLLVNWYRNTPPDSPAKDAQGRQRRYESSLSSYGVMDETATDAGQAEMDIVFAENNVSAMSDPQSMSSVLPVHNQEDGRAYDVVFAQSELISHLQTKLDAKDKELTLLRGLLGFTPDNCARSQSTAHGDLRRQNASPLLLETPMLSAPSKLPAQSLHGRRVESGNRSYGCTAVA